MMSIEAGVVSSALLVHRKESKPSAPLPRARWLSYNAARGNVSDMKDSDSIDNNIEQSQESTEAPVVVSRDELSRVQDIATQLIETLRDIPEGDLVGEIVANALKLLRDHTNRGDIKLIDKSFKELRYGLKVFAPFREVHKVSIFGSARTPESHGDYKQAAEFARKMAAVGWMVITGA